jgi:hypothetical protein
MIQVYRTKVPAFVINSPMSEMAWSDLVELEHLKADLSGIYTGDKTLHLVAISSRGNLKRWEYFY